MKCFRILANYCFEIDRQWVYRHEFVNYVCVPEDGGEIVFRRFVSVMAKRECFDIPEDILKRYNEFVNSGFYDIDLVKFRIKTTMKGNGTWI